MDIGTPLGIIWCLAMMYIAIHHGGTGIDLFWDPAGVAIVFGGAIGALCASTPMDIFLKLPKVIKNCFFAKHHHIDVEIERIAEFAALARKEGLLALEERIKTVEDPFLVKGLRLVVDGFPPEVVRDILSTDIAAMQERHSNGKAVLDKMAETGPAFGMLGTLIGLVQMLKNLSDPSQIGAGMAVALLTTFYGAVIANVIYMPLATRVEHRKKEETMLREIMVEGIAAIQAGDKPQMVKEKLRAFLSPRLRQRMDVKATTPK